MAKDKGKKSKGRSYEVDTTDYDESKDAGFYSGDEPKRGIYDGELLAFNEHESAEGNEGLKWLFRITEEPYAGWLGSVYSNMDSTKWRTEQIVLAIQGGKKGKMVLDPIDKDDDGKESKTVAAAKPVRLRIAQETYEDEKRGKIRAVLPVEGKAAKGKGKGKKSSDDDAFGDDD